MARTRVDRQAAQPRSAPFIKWAGGKASLVPRIIEVAKDGGFGRYFEPFLGGGAVFFALQPKGAVLSDSNPDLINVYIQVQTRVHRVVERLSEYQRAHSKEFYYATRRERPKDPTERAAWFLYLNRTCFNGLWRVNSSGQFNVPMGSYSNPRILDEGRLIRSSKTLRGAKLHCCDFETVLLRGIPRPRMGDLVYLDPPYDPLSETSSFTSYTKDDFERPDQKRLATVARSLAEKGVRVIVSDSDTPYVRSLYPNPPFETEVVKMSRAISSVGAGRGKISELLISG